MIDPISRRSQQIYEGVWGVLARLLLVPRHPPELPVQPDDKMLALHPAEGFLRYLKFQFWLGLAIVDGMILIAWLVLLIAEPIAGAVLAPLALAIAVLPDIVVYVGIHVLYDTTWYVLTRRSLRIRTGVWVLKEMTITFENVQNVTVNQGPLQRIFGIADVIVETAGGGAIQGPHGAMPNPLHTGVIRGVDNAKVIQGLIRERLGQSRTAGLGDELHAASGTSPQWRPEHVQALREIRDILRAAKPAL
jgi:membrane protein YdbS with pleckstrin-like domain